jgi:hypothetical protein
VRYQRASLRVRSDNRRDGNKTETCHQLGIFANRCLLRITIACGANSALLGQQRLFVFFHGSDRIGGGQQGGAVGGTGRVDEATGIQTNFAWGVSGLAALHNAPQSGHCASKKTYTVRALIFEPTVKPVSWTAQPQTWQSQWLRIRHNLQTSWRARPSRHRNATFLIAACARPSWARGLNESIRTQAAAVSATAARPPARLSPENAFKKARELPQNLPLARECER